MASTTLFTIPQQLFPAQTFTSPAHVVPVGVSQIEIACNVSAADLQDSSKSLAVTCQTDKSGSFQTAATFTWQGGNASPKSGLFENPVIFFSVGALVGSNIRLVVTNPQPLTIGFTVSVS